MRKLHEHRSSDGISHPVCTLRKVKKGYICDLSIGEECRNIDVGEVSRRDRLGIADEFRSSLENPRALLGLP